MVIHFSILGIIIIVYALREKARDYYSVNGVYRGNGFLLRVMPWIIIFGYIAFLAAMRSSMNDTSVYIHVFKRLGITYNDFTKQISGIGVVKDWGFDAINILFKKFISSNYHVWFAFYSCIESYVLVRFLRRNTVSMFDCCFFFLCSTLYYNYFSMMRQWFAVVLIFVASKYIIRKDFKKYLIVCVVLAQIHSSAYYMIPVYFVVQGTPWSQKQILFMIIFAILMIFLGPIMNGLDSTATGTTYDYAIKAMNTNSGSSPIRIIIEAVPVVLAFYHRKKIRMINKNPMVNLCINMSLLNLYLTILATFTNGLFVVRFATYFKMYNLILIPYLLNVAVNKKNRKIIKIAFYIFYLVFYYYQMKYQGAFGYGSDIIGYFG